MSAWLSRQYSLYTGPRGGEHSHRRFYYRFSNSSDDIANAHYEDNDPYATSARPIGKARRIARRGRDSFGITARRRSHSVGVGLSSSIDAAAAAYNGNATATSNDTATAMTAMHEAKDERVTVGSSHLTVSMLQGPHNHAIWRARLLAALNAEDETLYAAATGALSLNDDDNDAATAQQAADDERDMQQRRRAHIRCVAFITSTLPDSVYAMVMHHTADAYKLMEALDTRFRPYPRYAGAPGARDTK